MCRKSYRPEEMKALAEQEENCLLHMRCGNCGCFLLVAVAISPERIRSAGISTDLALDEVTRFALAESVSVDDVIVAHDRLNDLTLT